MALPFLPIDEVETSFYTLRTTADPESQVHRSDGKIRSYSIGTDVGLHRNSKDSHTKPIGTRSVFTGILTNGFRLGLRRKETDRKQTDPTTAHH